MNPILICYDGSADAEGAIDAAAALCGARPAVVLAVAPTITVAESIATTPSIAPRSAFDEEHAADARRRAREGAEYARRAGLAAAPRGVLASATWEGILEVADEVDAALIVVGSRGLSGLREFARGSVSHDVAAHAHRPVLIVPPRKGGET